MQSKPTPALPEDCVFVVLQYLSAKVYQNANSHNELDNVLDGMSLDPAKGKAWFPLETLPNIHAPGQWYSTIYPPYDLDSWKDVYRERHQKDATVRLLLEEIVGDSRNRMRHMDGIAKIGMIHARDVLDNIIAGRNGEERDLTRTYYARKTLKRLQRGWVLDQWRAYRTNSKSFPIWQGCGLMAMFSNHEMELSDIDRLLQDLADEFLEISPLPNVDHGSPAVLPTVIAPNNVDRYGPGSFSTSPDNRPSSEGNGPDSSSNKHSRYYEAQIDRLKQLIQFFTQEKGFKGNTDNYYDPFNSFIDKVLIRKAGIPISLCIVFDELARRAGIVGVELMGFPQHFMIRYRPQAPVFDPITSPLPSSETSVTSPPLPAPPTYFLDLFHPPHRLLSTEEYEDYFTRLGVPRPPDIYRDLPTPPLEIFLRCLRNIILAVEQTGGAGRIGSDHQASLYSGITQLLTLHPSEEWGLYVLWLKYLSNFWPEDIGLIRASIKDMEWTDHRRSAARGHMSSSSTTPNQGQSQHIFGYNQGVIYNTEYAGFGSSAHFTSSTHETIKILRAQVRELEIADETGEVGHIRRRRRPRVAPASAARATSQSNAPQQHDTTTESTGDEAQSSSTGNPITPSSAIDEASSHAQHSLEHQDPTLEEQQNESTNSGGNPETAASEHSPKAATTLGGEERRRPEPEYYVGEVFRHLIYRYPGAIYGYDLKCEAEEEWIRSMAIDTLKYGRHQPFYNALLSDGSRRYVAQENIHVLYREYRNTDASSPAPADQILSSLASNAASTPMPENVDTSIPSPQSSMSASSSLSASTTGETASSSAPPASLQYSELGPLDNEAVGQYFEAWDGQRGHYIMNKELRRLYPTEDYAQ
ncbi:hypothetical protein BGX21_007540 [Mortierella sp. AD011]|nr:hypothetical protein BGX20_009826 [Mortierella sp. AD010]KAF9398619.1 hypothetical protein BGX21_007540 [Mortierella sp. AD011]